MALTVSNLGTQASVILFIFCTEVLVYVALCIIRCISKHGVMFPLWNANDTPALLEAMSRERYV